MRRPLATWLSCAAACLVISGAAAAQDVVDLSAAKRRAEASCTLEAERQGLFEAPTDGERAAALDRKQLEEWLSTPRGEDELLRIVWLRHPAIEARRLRVKAVLSIYDQPDELEDLALRLRRLEPSGRRAPAGIAAAAAREQPKLIPLLGELADLLVEEAFESLRGEIVHRSALLIERLAEYRYTESEIAALDQHLAALRSMEEILAARIAAGRALQADLLALQEVTERHASRRRVREGERRHRTWAINESLHREPAAPFSLPPEPESPALPAPQQLASLASALRLDMDFRRAGALWRRSRLAFRRAELLPLAADGADAALVAELRSEVERTRAAQKAAAGDLGLACSRLHADFVAAVDRSATVTNVLLPIARSRLEVVRGAWAGNRGDFATVLATTREVIELEHEAAAAARDLQRERARLLRICGRR